MTHIEPHPDALIELHRQGQLSDATRAELAAHLEQCSACAAEVWASTVLVRECDPLVGDAELDRLAVRATLARLAARPARSARKRAWVWALAAALPLCAFAALSPFFANRANRARPPATASAAPSASLEPRSTLPTAAAPRAVPDVPLTDSLPSSSATPPEPASRLSGRSEPLGPSELLRRAGDLDRDGKRAQALEVYRELQQRYAASAQAKLSYVLVGSLLLAQAKYGPAIAQFDRYLAGSGPASEEALAGRATALQGLGEPLAEAASWRTLLARFPRSVHASHARQRLTALAAATDVQKPL